eukprot:TRINITY_DN1988_c0_g1::TRINITY_DN1988_c0_g1_i1::g.22967::m.22967 TRINITY_DN1988_c0_g1::TRINITY_DN1988_c0_g1_i1::g.22967  ORF type:complete len:125 (+),score=26.32 TRINITY_DN1988_c0_g1_i1:43-375(+)
MADLLVGAVSGWAFMAISNYHRSLPLGKYPWKHAAAIVGGAVLMNQYCKFEDNMINDLIRYQEMKDQARQRAIDLGRYKPAVEYKQREEYRASRQEELKAAGHPLFADKE